MPPTRRSTRTRALSTAASHPYRSNTTDSRPRSTPGTPASASLDRTTNNKLRLTVKAPPSKLRQATSTNPEPASFPPNPYADAAAASESDGPPTGRGARTRGVGVRRTRNPKTVIDPDSEEPEDDDEDVEMEDVDGEILAGEDSEDEDAEGEEDDEEEEKAEDAHPPPPIIKQVKTGNNSKPGVVVTAPPTTKPLKSVEAKETSPTPSTSPSNSNDDLSDLSEEDQGQEEEDEEDDDDDDPTNPHRPNSPSPTPSNEDDDSADLSRSATPDLSKLTRRQRGAYTSTAATDEAAAAAIDASVSADNLMALSNEAQKKKHLTAEEHAMRRAEMARRRKNLSERRTEEEKVRKPLFILFNRPSLSFLSHDLFSFSIRAREEKRPFNYTSPDRTARYPPILTPAASLL
ncbi:hypothetical protein B0A50_05562 [Salinomyces thailandicus]|uniref:INO80 complex subunit B-like conserved region domain-containing protein n=1 Tax=Salinomyces thailandicus TaxID=706561 RepID=A0A4U0TUE4_9PEZI|nr:hypothetical protein B0A50_05562 [Salinomyces thailandica]